jgi:hypothetical protein
MKASLCPVSQPRFDLGTYLNSKSIVLLIYKSTVKVCAPLCIIVACLTFCLTVC